MMICASLFHEGDIMYDTLAIFGGCALVFGIIILLLFWEHKTESKTRRAKLDALIDIHAKLRAEDGRIWDTQAEKK